MSLRFTGSDTDHRRYAARRVRAAPSVAFQSWGAGLKTLRRQRYERVGEGGRALLVVRLNVCVGGASDIKSCLDVAI